MNTRKSKKKDLSESKQVYNIKNCLKLLNWAKRYCIIEPSRNIKVERKKCLIKNCGTRNFQRVKAEYKKKCHSSSFKPFATRNQVYWKVHRVVLAFAMIATNVEINFEGLKPGKFSYPFCKSLIGFYCGFSMSIDNLPQNWLIFQLSIHINRTRQ